MTHFLRNLCANSLLWLPAIGVFLPLSSNAQKIAVGFRAGQSFSNYVNHDYSGTPITVQVPALSLPYTPPTTVPGGVSYYPPGTPWYGQNGQQPGTQMETRTYANYYKTNFVEDLRLALFAGLFLNIGLNPKWSIEPGLSYVQKGIRLRSTVTRYLPDQNTQQRITYDNTIHTNYIVMPVVAKYNLGRRERVFLLGGIYNALAVRSRGVFQGTTETAYSQLGTINPGYNPDASYTPSSGYWQRDNDLVTKRYDFGVTLGGGMQWPITGRIALGFDVRGNMGVLSLADASNAVTYYGFNKNARNLNIEAGVRLIYALKP